MSSAGGVAGAGRDARIVAGAGDVDHGVERSMELPVPVGAPGDLELRDERVEGSPSHEHTVPEAKCPLVRIVELCEAIEGGVRGQAGRRAGTGSRTAFAVVALLAERRGG